MAYESKTDNPDGLKYSRRNDREPFGCITFQIRGDMGTFNEDGDDNYYHAYKREARSARQFMDVAVERKRVGDADCTESNNELAIGKNPKHGYAMQRREYRADYMGNGIS